MVMFLLCVFSGVSECSGSEMRFVGYVEISDEASLDDLKTQVGQYSQTALALVYLITIAQ